MSVKSALRIKLNGRWVALPVMIGDAEIDGVVRYDAEQTLTEKQKATARKNIGADTGGNFTTDATLTLSEDGVLSVNTADEVEKDNTLPVTSAAVYTEVGNINALLATI